MDRRKFVKALAGLPLVGALIKRGTAQAEQKDILACDHCQIGSFPKLDRGNRYHFSVMFGDGYPEARVRGRYNVEQITIDDSAVDVALVRDVIAGRDGVVVELPEKPSACPRCPLGDTGTLWRIRRGVVRVKRTGHVARYRINYDGRTDTMDWTES